MDTIDQLFAIKQIVTLGAFNYDAPPRSPRSIKRGGQSTLLSRLSTTAR